MLADFLRYEKRLTGTKIVCAEGDCGACTVLLMRWGQQHFIPINACIAPVFLVDNCHIVTVEGLKENQQLNAVQQAIVDHHGSQCGYCTPGFVMAITGIFEKPCADRGEQRIKNCLTGNLCRCTGYQPLIEAARAVDPKAMTPLAKRFITTKLIEECEKSSTLDVHIIGAEGEFFAPRDIDAAIRFRHEHPHARVIAGATDLGVLLNKGKIAAGKFLSLHLIPSLREVRMNDERIHVGALVTLSELRRVVKKAIPEFADFLNIFASPQIKNVATLVGNIANGSPIADTVPFLMVADGQVHVTGQKAARSIAVADLYRGYKVLALDASELITHVSFATPSSSQSLRLEKVSQRRDLDISTVNCAFLFDVDDNSAVKAARIAVGGIAASVIRLKKTEWWLTGKILSNNVIDEASQHIAQEILPLSDLRGSADYRRALVDGLFRRYCYGVIDHVS